MADNLDSTFRNFTSTQAVAYATHRTDPYSQRLYDVILRYHSPKGGKFDTLLDVGCGTGQVTRSLAPYFSQAIGVDPGAEMISQARDDSGFSKNGKPVIYEVRAAEELAGLGEIHVDLLVAGMAAHWFNMPEFWVGASKVLKSGGTVALWTHSSFYCLPTTENATKVQEALSNLEDGFLGPYESEGIRISRNMYDTLLMPWDCLPQIPGFSKDQHVRHEWNRNGKLELGQEDFFSGSDEYTMQKLRDAMGTTSMVTKWRAANPDLVGTDQDCVEITVKNVAKALGRNDKESHDLTFRAGCATPLLLFTRS